MVTLICGSEESGIIWLIYDSENFYDIYNSSIFLISGKNILTLNGVDETFDNYYICGFSASATSFTAISIYKIIVQS